MKVLKKNSKLAQCSSKRWPTVVLTLAVCASAVVLNVDRATAQSFYQRGGNESSSQPKSQWQPPASNQPVAKVQAEMRPSTNLVPLRPPRDIFTQTTPPQTSSVGGTASQRLSRLPPASQLAPPPIAAPASFNSSGLQGRSIGSLARELPTSNTASRTSNGLFDSISALDDDGQPKFAQANLLTDAMTSVNPKTDLEVITSGATAKLGEVKDWMGEKTTDLFGSVETSGWQDRISQMFGGADVKKIVGGLAVVIGGYLGLVWLLRMINPGGGGGIPREVLEVVGTVPLNNRQQLQLVRLGSKLLLMMHSAEGTQSIAEITDPAEVEHLLELCSGRGNRAGLGARLSSLTQRTSALPTNSPSSNDTINQLLRALEKHQPNGHLFEA